MFKNRKFLVSITLLGHKKAVKQMKKNRNSCLVLVCSVKKGVLKNFAISQENS